MLPNTCKNAIINSIGTVTFIAGRRTIWDSEKCRELRGMRSVYTETNMMTGATRVVASSIPMEANTAASRTANASAALTALNINRYLKKNLRSVKKPRNRATHQLKAPVRMKISSGTKIS